jgi:hypothetical protein
VVNKNTSTIRVVTWAVTSGCLQEMNNFLDGIIGFVISGFEWDFGACLGVGPVVEETIGEGGAEALMQKEETTARRHNKVFKPWHIYFRGNLI